MTDLDSLTYDDLVLILTALNSRRRELRNKVIRYRQRLEMGGRNSRSTERALDATLAEYRQVAHMIVRFTIERKSRR